jgi:hypothetical protein
MSQLVSCKNENGIVLAADSKAIEFDLSGEMKALTVERMIQLSARIRVKVVKAIPSWIYHG